MSLRRSDLLWLATVQDSLYSVIEPGWGRAGLMPRSTRTALQILWRPHQVFTNIEIRAGEVEHLSKMSAQSTVLVGSGD